jgi:uncharacterized membrane protein
MHLEWIPKFIYLLLLLLLLLLGGGDDSLEYYAIQQDLIINFLIIKMDKFTLVDLFIIIGSLYFSLVVFKKLVK